MKAKPFISKSEWAVFSPDGYVQVRSISPKRKDSIEYLLIGEADPNVRWEDYLRAGYFLSRVSVRIEPLNEEGGTKP